MNLVYRIIHSFVVSIILLFPFRLSVAQLYNDYNQKNNFLRSVQSPITHSINSLICPLFNTANFADFVIGNLGFMSHGMFLVIVDFSNPSTPVLLGKIKTPSKIEDIFVYGNNVYVANGDSGLHIIDVREPSTPVVIGYYYVPVFVKGVHVTDGYAYVATRSGELYKIDVHNPQNPMLEGFYNNKTYTSAIRENNDYQLFRDEKEGHSILNNTQVETFTEDMAKIPTKFSLKQNYPNPL